MLRNSSQLFCVFVLFVNLQDKGKKELKNCF